MLTRASHLNKTVIVYSAIMLMALFLRLNHLNKFDLWFDELATEVFSAQNLNRWTDLAGTEMVSLAADWVKRDPHSPVYYAFIFLSSMITGDGTGLRLLSVMFSMLALGVFYKISRLFFDDRTSLTALAIMALSPFHLWYAQEARAYAMATFFLLAAFYAFMRGVMTGSTKYWASFVVAGVFSILSIYNSAVFLALTGGMFFIKDYRPYFRKWLLSLAGICAVCLFAGGIFLPQADFVKNDFWIRSPSPRTLLYTWHFFTLGYSATPAQYNIAIAPFLGLCAYGIYLYFRTDKRKVAMLFLLFTLPLAATFIFSKVFFPVYLYRQVIVYSPVYYLFIARGIQGIRPLAARIAAAVFVAAMMLMSIANYYEGYLLYGGDKTELTNSIPPKKNYSAVLKRMLNEYQQGDLIAAADLQAYAMTRSFVSKNLEGSNRTADGILKFLIFPRDLFAYDQRYLGIKDIIFGIPRAESVDLHELTALPGGEMGLAKSRIVQDGIRRIWVVSSSWLDLAPVEPNYLSLRGYLWNYYESKVLALKEGIQIELFVRKENPN